MHFVLLYQYIGHWHAIVLRDYNVAFLCHCWFSFITWWAVDIQIWALLTRSQCKVSDTQVTVKACGPLVIECHKMFSCESDWLYMYIVLRLLHGFCSYRTSPLQYLSVHFAPMPLNKERSLSCYISYDSGLQFTLSHPKYCTVFVPVITKTGLLRIYFNPDPHWSVSVLCGCIFGGCILLNIFSLKFEKRRI